MISAGEKVLATMPVNGYKLHFYSHGEICGTLPILAFLLVEKLTRQDKLLTIEPVTPEWSGHWRDQQPFAIEWPDGQFHLPEEQTFGSRAAFEQHIAEEYMLGEVGEEVPELVD